MDAKSMLLHLQETSKLKTTTTADWNKILDKYPYFATAQLLKYAADTNAGKEDITFAALYKQDPLLFAEWISTIQQLKIAADIPISTVDIETKKEILVKKEIENVAEIIIEEEIIVPIIEVEKVAEIKKVEPEKDILELINELPNTNPIDLNVNKKEEKVDKKETFSQEELKHVEPIIPEISNTLPDKSLMVMMSFTDWLNYFKHKRENEIEEEHSKKVLKTSWQKEKLTAAMEEDVDEIPEPIFQQAMDSITMESSMVSESLAKILASQGKVDKAIDMYKKLSLRFPEKRTYFADLIEKLNLKRD